MPRVNPNRTMVNEKNLARRIEFERRRHEMSTDGLAKRMTALGLPMQKTTIFKIENETRRITVDELVGFAAVFELDVLDMLTPVETVIDREISEAVERLTNLIDFTRSSACQIVPAIAEWSKHRGVNAGLDALMASLRKSPNDLKSGSPVQLPDDCVVPFNKFIAALWKAGESTAVQGGR